MKSGSFTKGTKAYDPLPMQRSIHHSRRSIMLTTMLVLALCCLLVLVAFA